MKKKRVLITGGAGFIGANLARKLVSEGDFDVFVIEKKGVNTWRLKDILHEINVMYVDLENFNKLQKVITNINPNFVFHLAAYGVYSAVQVDIRKMININITGTLNLIESLKNSNLIAFINAGSCGEYKAKKSSIIEDDPVDPSNEYHITKLSAELLLKKIAKRQNLPIINLRLFTAYGFYEDSQRLIPSLILHAFDNKKIELSSPNYVRDFIFIEDLTNAFLKILQNKKRYQGDIFNIGSGKQHRIKEVVTTIERILGKKINTHYGSRKSYYDEPAYFQANPAKAKIAFNWKPSHNLKKGLTKTIQWLQENKKYYNDNLEKI